MKKIEVIVKDKNTLILEENAQKGDYIDLTSISNIDYTQIETAILAGKDDVYTQRIKEYEEKQSLKIEQIKNELGNIHSLEIQKLQMEIKNLNQDYQSKLQQEKEILTHQYSLEIKDYTNEISHLKERLANDLLQAKKEEASKHLEKIQSLTLELERKNSVVEQEKAKHQIAIQEYEHQLQSLQNRLELQLKSEFFEKQKEYENQIADLKKEKETIELSKKLELEQSLHNKDELFSKERLELKTQIDDLTKQYQTLQRQKAALNVKQTGEDLEVWCDNEVRSYMQNGFQNCLWQKDNMVVRNEEETKGSKADYIFSIYASEEKETLLTSICLDMKDENPDSVNRKKNSDYFKALDNNRKKKECKYAVLVSNLELDRPNDIPIYRVNEYEDMYVVRPAYLMTFLNMVVSLTLRFSTLILAKHAEEAELKDLREVQELFEDLKKTYLDKPLQNLENHIEDIRSQNEKIKSASNKIEEHCDAITRSYLHEIQNKLERFDLRVERAYKKIGQ